MSRYSDASLMSGLGYRRRRRRVGRGILSSILGIAGLGRRRRHYRGRGFLDTLKSVASYALPVVGSAILGKAGSAIGSRLFGGRRRRRRYHRRRYGIRRRRYHRRHYGMRRRYRRRGYGMRRRYHRVRGRGILL